MPVKLSAVGATEIVQAACTLNVTEMLCGLPTAGLPELSVPLIVIVPWYVAGTRLDSSVADTLRSTGD
jgi:hypothetical protein